MKNLLKLSLLTLLVSLVSTPIVFAVGTNNSDYKIKLVSTIEIRDVKIISQEGGKFNISFSISNGSIAQSNMKYGVRMVGVLEDNKYTADEKVYDEVLNLNINTQLTKNIVYEAPSYLSGNFNMVVIGKSESGLTLATNSFSKVSLEASSKSVLINNESCHLSVRGESDNNEYDLVQGVDILPTESLILNCQIQNDTESEQNLLPVFDTFHRSIYGSSVETGNASNIPVTVKPGEKKSLSLEIPKPLKPQAYDVVVSLGNNEILSNSITVHYVLRGQSASIQNISLDNNYYKKGGNANAFVFWSPSADIFTNSRIKSDADNNYNISILITENNKACSPEYKKAITSKDKILEIPLPINKNTCKNPKLSVVISDKDGQILDKMDAQFTSTNIPKDNTLYIYIIMISLIILTIIFYVKNKSHNNKDKRDNNISNTSIPLSILFFVFIITGFMLPRAQASALGFTVYNDILDTDDMNVTASINKSIYTPNDTSIITTASMETTNCLNSYSNNNNKIEISLKVHNGIFNTSEDEISLITVSDTVNNLTNFYREKSGDLGIPDTVGSYNATFTASILGNGQEAYGDGTIQYTVVTPYTPPVIPRTVNVEAYRASNPSTPILKNASKVTTDPIAPEESIFLKWNAEGFGSNVICTVPPNGDKTTVNTTFGKIDFPVGPSVTTKYTVSCTDD